VAFHEDLRNHRLKKGLILEEISEDTKINVRILQALEQGDYHILPVPYVRLFMKAYAQTMDYPVEDVLRGLENELTLTGDQSSSTQVPADIAASVDMTGAALSNAQNLLQSGKPGQSSITRLMGGIIVLLVVIIFGKSLLKTDGSDRKSPPRQVLPGINMNQGLDSSKIDLSLLSGDEDNVSVIATSYLSIILMKGSDQIDTLLYNPGQTLITELNDSTRISIYPSDAALISVKRDTLPGSPFNNAWVVISADAFGGHIKTYSTL